MLLNPEVCTHDDFLMNPKVRKIYQGENGPVIDFILEFSIKCSHCHLPFKFVGPMAGIVVNQPVVSKNELVLSVPILPNNEAKLFLSDKVGQG